VAGRSRKPEPPRELPRDQFDLFAPRKNAVLAEPIAVRQAAPALPSAPRLYSVGELTRELKGAIEERYAQLSVQGEVSNLSRPASGHLYFTLKDAEATLAVVLFRNQARLLRFELQNGQKVVCRGRLTLYPPRGQYQLAADTLEPTGVGALAVAYEQLKQKLAAEGLFEAARKRAVPVLPRRIGVVTSPSGAAVRDFLRVLHQRFPGLPVLIAPARVQGESAGGDIAAAIRDLNAWSAKRPERERLEVIVVTRGGGSIEDLWAFNEEVVARAIAASALPVVSAVGHEVDFTIADFVADLRCPTPTAAAERLAPERVKELEQLAVRRRRLVKGVERATAQRQHALVLALRRLGDPRRELTGRHLHLDTRADALDATLRRQLAERARNLTVGKERLHRAHPREQLLRNERALRATRGQLGLAMRRELGNARSELQQLRERLAACSPTSRLERAHRVLSEKRGRLGQLGTACVERQRRHLGSQAARLHALSPLGVLGRGYAIAFDIQGHVLRRAQDVQLGQKVRVRLGEGELSAEVEQVRGPSVE